MNGLIQQARGEIRAVVERHDSPYRQRKNERFFTKMTMSPADKYGAELTVFERSILARKANPGPPLMLKIVDFPRRKYFYYYPKCGSINGLYLLSNAVYFLGEQTVVLMLADFCKIIVQRYFIEYDRCTLTIVSERLIDTHVGMRLHMMPTLFMKDNSAYAVVCELGKHEFGLYPIENDGEEFMINYPTELVSGTTKFVLSTDNRMLIGNYAFIEGKEVGKKSGKFLIRARLNKNFDMDGCQFMKFPRDDLQIATANQHCILYEVYDMGEHHYFILDVGNFKWRNIEVTDHPHNFVVVNGSRLVLFTQEEEQGIPVKATPLRFRTVKL